MAKSKSEINVERPPSAPDGKMSALHAPAAANLIASGYPSTAKG